MRVLVTGFGPFGDVEDNPSGRLARRVAERLGARCLLLPTSYRRAGNLVDGAVRGGDYSAILLLGVVSGSSAIRLERYARNRTGIDAPDADGEQPGGRFVVADGPERLETTANLETIEASLSNSGVPCERSEDAGAYVCNHTYYRALWAVREARPSMKCLFAHVPRDEASSSDGAFVPFEEQAVAIEAVLLALMRLAGSEATRPPSLTSRRES